MAASCERQTGNVNKVQGWAAVTHAEPFDVRVPSACANRELPSRHGSSPTAWPNPGSGARGRCHRFPAAISKAGRRRGQGEGHSRRSGFSSSPRSWVLVASTHLIGEELGTGVWGQG